MAEDRLGKDLNIKKYVLNWLCSAPTQLRYGKSIEQDMDKRVERLTDALLKESDKNITRLTTPKK